MKYITIGTLAFIAALCLPLTAKAPVSEKSESCIECHSSLHPGIVADWEKSVHSRTARSGKNSVGCAECHTINTKRHADSFEHNDHKVNIVVSPVDCATCHKSEANQYKDNKMYHAYGNLIDNPLYKDLVNSVNGLQIIKGSSLEIKKPTHMTNADSCLFCHGTDVKVLKKEKVDTDMGEMTFPVLSGWPNQGVGRLNPDGSKGSCSSCHTRHAFSSETARKPETCSQCHKGPDVPAYKVYKVSKHGNIYSSHNKEWDFKANPWIVGKHYTAPTCATCHISKVVNSDNEVIARRTHGMSDRLSWRIFGLVYAHPQTKSPNTTIIKNKGGLSLPTELTGEPVRKYLIDTKEQKKRDNTMRKICLSCHSSGWVQGHFTRLDNTIKTTNASTLAATKILLRAWKEGICKGPGQKDSPFNEVLEKMWVEHWLFYANSTRFAGAMAGADYGAFANGRWYMSKNLRKMYELLDMQLKIRSAGK